MFAARKSGKSRPPAPWCYVPATIEYIHEQASHEQLNKPVINQSIQYIWIVKKYNSFECIINVDRFLLIPFCTPSCDNKCMTVGFATVIVCFASVSVDFELSWSVFYFSMFFKIRCSFCINVFFHLFCRP